MRLYPELNAEFVQYIPPSADSPRGGMRRGVTLEDAHGVLFQCPLCAQGKPPAEDGLGVQGAHYVLCWFRNPRRWAPVSDDVDPKPGRWWATGTGLQDLTFDHGDPPMAKSVQLLGGGCNWHGFVEAGSAA